MLRERESSRRKLQRTEKQRERDRDQTPVNRGCQYPVSGYCHRSVAINDRVYRSLKLRRRLEAKTLLPWNQALRPRSRFARRSLRRRLRRCESLERNHARMLARTEEGRLILAGAKRLVPLRRLPVRRGKLRNILYRHLQCGRGGRPQRTRA